MTALVQTGPRELMLTLAGAPVATLRLGVPGVDEAPADPDEVLRTRLGPVTTRVRLFEDVDATSLIVGLENTGDEAVETPAIGLSIEPDAAWSGWSWTTDVEGFIVLSGPAGPVLLQLRQGFLRAARERPVFASDGRSPRSDGGPRRPDPMAPGEGAFHLVRPGELAAGDRRQTVLRVSRLPDADAAASLLPAWLPPLVEPEGTEVVLATPDLGVVAGPGVDGTLSGHTLMLLGPAGHREVALHGVRGVQRLRVTWVPRLVPWLADLAHALRSRRPSVVSSATGAVVAEALARGAVLDGDALVDWLEREDWLARGDALGVATATVLGAHTGDDRLLADAWAALRGLPVVPGFGLLTMKVWLALLSATGAAPDLAGELLRRRPADEVAALELSLLGGGDQQRDEAPLLAIVRRLGGTLPGQPLRLAAPDAALLVGVLRLCPEGWPSRRAASEAAEKGAGLLLADHVDGLHPEWDGLAWLLVGQLGS